MILEEDDIDVSCYRGDVKTTNTVKEDGVVHCYALLTEFVCSFDRYY